MVRRLIFALLLAAATAVALGAAQASTWPSVYSIYAKDIVSADLSKTVNCSPSETFDPKWIHLHQGMAECETAALGVWVESWYGSYAGAALTGVQLRWTVNGVPVSGWLEAPFAFTLRVDNPALPALDGIFHIDAEVQGVSRNSVTTSPAFLHLSRGRSVSDVAPLIGSDQQEADKGATFGPGVRPLRYADMRFVGRPADPAVVPWHGPTWQEPGLYQEEMAPHSDLFFGQAFWWEEPAGSVNAGLKFPRILVPKWSEEHRDLRVAWHHDKFPFVDGPRGVAWTSTYITGQVDPQGNFCFVETGGPLRCMAPDGTVTTFVGWHVTAGKAPAWASKDICLIRANESFEGQFVSGRYASPACAPDGFRTPLDLAIDPQNARIFYVAGYEDNAIWRADCRTFPTSPCQVSVFAGAVDHVYGFADGVGTAARFNGPSGLVFDPVCDCLRVADQNNDAIRTITRAGVVSTLFGSPGQDLRQVVRGVTTQDRGSIQGLNRAAAGVHYTRPAGSPVTLETYLPQAIRVDSTGRLILLDIGFGAIRRINPATLEATELQVVNQRFDRNDEGAPMQGITGSSRGWAGLDVDRWGNAGPLDEVYFFVFQNASCAGETRDHLNEAYCETSGAGTPGRYLFPSDWDPDPDGWGPRELTDPSHYPWAVAVDPRGALYMAGSGEHGVTRLRKARPTDVTFANQAELERYGQAKTYWRFGCGGSGPAGPWLSPLLRNGSEGHGYLGLPDASETIGRSDADVIALFGLTENACTDATRLDLVWFLRKNAWPPVSAPSGPPPPVDPCVAQPLVVKVKTWPTQATGSRSLAWDSGQARLVSFVVLWAPSLRVTFTDMRGCTVTRIK